MSPENFTIAIIGAIASGLTAIVVGIVGVVANRRTSAKVEDASQKALSIKSDIKDDVNDLGEKMLAMVNNFGKELNNAHKDTIDDLRKHVANQGQQLTAVLESQQHIIKDAALVREENAGFRRDIEAYKQTTSELQDDNRAIKNELVSQRNYSKTLESELDKARRAYEQTILTTSNQLNEAKTELERVKQENAELKVQAKKVDELTKRVVKLEQDVKTMTEERDQFVKRINELEAQRDAAIQRAERAELENIALRADLELEKKRGTGRLVAQAGGDPIDTSRGQEVVKKKTDPNIVLPQTARLTDPTPTITPVVQVDISKPVTGTFATPTTTSNEETQKLPIVTPKMTGETPNA